MEICQKKRICPDCETVNRPGAAVCAGCGRVLPDTAQEAPPPQEEAGNQIGEFTGEKVLEIPEDALHRIAGWHSEYYVKVWKKLVRRKVPVSFSLPAFFLGALWFSARKMIKSAVIYVLAGILVSAAIAFAGEIEVWNTENTCLRYEAALLPEAKAAAVEYYSQKEAEGGNFRVVDAQRGEIEEQVEIVEGVSIPYRFTVREGELSRLIASQEQDGEYPFLKPFRGREEYQALAKLDAVRGKTPGWVETARLIASLVLSVIVGLFGNYCYFRRAEEVYWEHTSQPGKMAELGGISVKYAALFALAASAVMSLAELVVRAVF